MRFYTEQHAHYRRINRHDKTDARKLTGLPRGGVTAMAYVYPPAGCARRPISFAST